MVDLNHSENRWKQILIHYLMMVSAFNPFECRRNCPKVAIAWFGLAETHNGWRRLLKLLYGRGTRTRRKYQAVRSFIPCATAKRFAENRYSEGEAL